MGQGGKIGQGLGSGLWPVNGHLLYQALNTGLLHPG